MNLLHCRRHFTLYFSFMYFGLIHQSLICCERKCCTQHASKFRKLSSGHRTGKGQFSFQSKRKAMSKNVQTTTKLHSSHTLVKWSLKLSRPGFSNTLTMNFQMFKLVLEKAEEPEFKLPTSTGLSKKQESYREHLFLLY